MWQKRQDRLEAALALLEADFRVQLIAELHRCARGEWGLFGQNKHLGNYGRDTQELDALGLEIQRVRDELGIVEPFALHDRLIRSRCRNTQNDLGEARLAALWLQELDT